MLRTYDMTIYANVTPSSMHVHGNIAHVAKLLLIIYFCTIAAICLLVGYLERDPLWANILPNNKCCPSGSFHHPENLGQVPSVNLRHWMIIN
jgi:hypothetical protein